MSRMNFAELIDEGYDPQSPRIPRFRPRKRSQHAVLDEIAQHAPLQALGAEEAFNPSLNTKLHEREWIFTFLGPFYENAYIKDVVRRIKGGKEANVYVCEPHPSLDLDLLAAKLYRPRAMRNLRNDARYRAGRTVLDADGKAVDNEKELHAVQKGSSYGKELAHTSWLAYEYRALVALSDAGLPVPKPVTIGSNAILMEYIGELDLPAPALNETSLPRSRARRAYDELVDAIERMLGLGWIHADLSAYNVLYWDDRPVIIDFPQAINPWRNKEAWDIFARDVTRICQYFEKYGIRSNPIQMAKAMWNRQSPTPPIDPLAIEREEAGEEL
jgi:RIO kinase 1